MPWIGENQPEDTEELTDTPRQTNPPTYGEIGLSHYVKEISHNLWKTFFTICETINISRRIG